MTRVAAALAALVGTGLVLAAGIVLVDDSRHHVEPAVKDASRTLSQPRLTELAGGAAVLVSNPLLVVNDDGSAAVGATLQNVSDVEVALLGVVVRANHHRLAVNATPWSLPVPAGQSSQVGSASDAGGFVIPRGLTDGSDASVEFHFDDGTCASAEVTAVARTASHRSVYPRTNRPIGPTTTDRPPPGTTGCPR